MLFIQSKNLSNSGLMKLSSFIGMPSQETLEQNTLTPDNVGRHMKTIEQFMAQLDAEGKTVIQWAEEHEFPAWAVYRVTSGGNKGRRGRAHQIMVAMGIKADPEQQAA